jgi:hypothetical protein
MVVLAAATRSVVLAVAGRKSQGVGMGDLVHGDTTNNEERKYEHDEQNKEIRKSFM